MILIKAYQIAEARRVYIIYQSDTGDYYQSTIVKPNSPVVDSFIKL